MNGLKQQIIWITGASSGIGEALALQLAKNGNKLILSGRNKEALMRVCEKCNKTAKAEILVFDIIDIENHHEIAKDAWNIFGKIDVLINNAGVSQRSLVMETTTAVERNLMEVNFYAPVSLTKALLPYFIEQKSGQIVVISSIAGKFGFALRSTYAASKHALQGYFEALRLELKDIPIYITIICPGRVLTNISYNALNGKGNTHAKLDDGQRHGISAAKCARKIEKAIKNKQYEVLIGKLELIPVFLRRFCPSLFYFLIKRVKAT
jgi:dehydrogenase/reductase SDR family protein 7B